MDELFLFGLAALGAAQRPDLSADRRTALLDAAVALFHAMLVARPGLVRVRLELARALFLKGRDGLARRHFEQVLAGSPPQAVAANVQGYLGRIRARRGWDMHAGFALAPDTNIGGTTDEQVIYIFGLPSRRSGESLTTSEIGVLAWGGGEYQHPLRDGLGLRAGVDLAVRDHVGRRFDQVFVSTRAGPQADPARSRQHTDVLAWFDRRHRTRTFLDGPVLDLSLGGVWPVTPAVRANAGIGWGRERPERTKWRHQHRWIRVGVSVDLARGITLGGSGHLRWTDYEGDWFPHTDGRQEPH